jgi:hypothetical protein
MKRLAPIAAAFLWFLAPSGYAADPNPPHAEEECEDHLSRMQHQMKKMHGEMEEIRGTRNPEERRKLLDGHWKTMQGAMETMENVSARCRDHGPGMGRHRMHRGMMEGMMMGGRMPPASDPGQLPESESDGARLVSRYCTQCHELPLPALHTAEGWTPVAQRMHRRMQWMSENGSLPIRVPTDLELQSIIGYLQEHAAP